MIETSAAKAFQRDHDLDAIDLQILDALQGDARLSRAEVARRVGLSTAAVHERIRKLERAGVILRYAALLDPEKTRCDLLAFVEVFIDRPTREPAFLKAIGQMPQVQECHRVTGAATCLLKVRVHDRHALHKLILDRINAMSGVRGTETVVVLSTTKETPRLDLAGVAEGTGG
jgi:Lrp/AsnC family leucine-responsive transcriptional regulator